MWVINAEGGLWVHEPQQFVVSKQRHNTERDTMMRSERDRDSNISDDTPVPTHAKCPMCGKTVNVTIRGEYAGHPRDRWYTMNDAGTELTGECPASGTSALDNAVEALSAAVRYAAERTNTAKAACAQANMRLEDALNVEARARNRLAALESLLRAKKTAR